jgi:hypothetical protein
MESAMMIHLPPNRDYQHMVMVMVLTHFHFYSPPHHLLLLQLQWVVMSLVEMFPRTTMMLLL